MNDKKPLPPSELFERVILRSGHLVVDCDLCHRTHFATATPEAYDDGELEDLQAKAKKHPDQYIEDPQHDNVSAGAFGGGVVAVLGCQCNLLRRYEDLFWNNRQLILEYIKRRVAERRKSVDKDEKVIAETESAT